MDRSFEKLTPMQKALYKQLYKKSFYDFVKDFWECWDPAPLVDGFLVQFYCEIFQYYCRNWVPYKPLKIGLPKEYKDYKVIDCRTSKRNLNVNVPPRHSKSAIFNVAGPVWLWLTYPIKAASISHTFGLSKDMNAKRQKLINSEKFKFFFGTDFSLISNTIDTLKDNRGGELYSKNRDSMTGFGCDLAIVDDATNAEQARKDKQEMANAWSFFQNTLPSRINDIKTGVIINIQQRLAPNDITGHIMNDPKLKDTYFFITLPAIFDENTVLVCPISGDILAFKAGDPLWPERFGNYEALRAQVGEGVFQTQYLQRPIASDRTVIKPHMLNERDCVSAPEIAQADMIYASHDFPVKDKETSDFLGSILAYRVGPNLYIKDCLEKKMAFVESIEYAESLSNFYTGVIQIIEDKANGSPIIQQLHEKIAGVQPFNPGTKSKMQRLESATIYLPNVYFVKDQYNSMTGEYTLSEPLENLKRRLLNFPFVEHDDIVDAFTQLLLFVYMDRQYMVYGRSFNEYNLCEYSQVTGEYSTMFFNKDGDLWKVCEIAVRYGAQTTMCVKREWMFRASPEEGLKNLKKFAPNQNLFIDASAVPSFYGGYNDGLSIEYYGIDNFELSVNNLNLAFGKKIVTLDKSCKAMIADIESFKYDKMKDENFKFKTEQDGFVSCLRIAMKYYAVNV